MYIIILSLALLQWIVYKAKQMWLGFCIGRQLGFSLLHRLNYQNGDWVKKVYTTLHICHKVHQARIRWRRLWSRVIEEEGGLAYLNAKLFGYQHMVLGDNLYVHTYLLHHIPLLISVCCMRYQPNDIVFSKQLTQPAQSWPYWLILSLSLPLSR